MLQIVEAPSFVHFRLGIKQLTIYGSLALYQRIFQRANQPPTLALLSSQKAPASILLAVHDLAQQWRQSGPVIISGFQSSVENEALSVLLRGPQPVVICLARGMLQRIPPIYRTPLDEGRLLLVTSFSESVQRTTRRTAQQRNRLVAALADQVLFAHAQPGSQTEQLAHEVVEWEKPVMMLEHEANQNLLTLGLQQWPKVA